MMACLLAAFAIPAAAFAVDPIVAFPDAALNSAVHTTMGIPLATPIYASDLTTLTALTAPGAGIEHLDGLEWATHLASLNLYNNNIGTITPLAGCTALSDVNIDMNDISDFTPLAGISHLHWLKAGSNPATSLAGIENQAELQYLDVQFAQIESIAPVANHPVLQNVYLYSNDITDLAPLKSDPVIKNLSLGGNPSIVDVSALSTMTTLSDLALSIDDSLSDLSPLAGLTNLKSLNLYGCTKVVDVSPLGNLTKLDWLNLDNCSVYDITPLRHLSGDNRQAVRMSSNWLDLTPGSDSAQTVAWLTAHDYGVEYDPQRPGGAIVGVAHDAVSGKPLAGVLAKLTDGPVAVSGASGAYTIGLAKPGTRTLTFSKPHYSVVATSFALSMGATSTVGVSLVPTLLTPTLKRSPSASSLTYSRKKGVAKFTLSATLSDGLGAAPGTGVWLQKRTSSKKKWTTLYKLTTNPRGNVSKAFAVKKKGTTYYRWISVATTLDRSVTSKSQTVRIR